MLRRRTPANSGPSRNRAGATPSASTCWNINLADVGACFEALLAQPAIRQRLARSGGLDDLDPAAAARLSLFAALHDIGKVNVGFQTQIWRDADLPEGQRRPRRAGHYRELVPVMMQDNKDTAGWFFDSLGWWWDAVESWDDRDGETVCALFVAALSHHGRPLQLGGGLNSNSALWKRFGGLNPSESVRSIGELARQWFPEAWNSNGKPLPSAPAFQHHFLGLCNLADWIGSNEKWFGFRDGPDDNYMETARKNAARAIAEAGLSLQGQSVATTAFADLFPHVRQGPNAVQQAAADAPLSERLVIIESETGSGKTEAALWRFARMREAGLVDGLYFALPTRAAAVQIHGRVERFVANLFPSEPRPAVVLAVPGYEAGADAADTALHDYDSHAAGHPEDDRPWASESPKRYLAAQIAVGTVDQAMMGALKVKNAHMRAACLSRNLLVVDEVHASDVYMSVVLEALLNAHVGAGGYALLMSATLGSAARKRWLGHGDRTAQEPPPLDDAKAAPYPAIGVPAESGDGLTFAGENGREKTVNITAAPEMGDFAAVAQRALDAARAGAKVLAVRNTVDYAIGLQQALEELAAPGERGLLFSAAGATTLHHGRFAPGDRRLLDGEIEARLGRNRRPGGLVVAGTQTLEQSLDIDADLLITDLCPVDVLLQRIGRLHRHRDNVRPAGYDTPACVVLTPEGNDLSPLLRSGQDANGLGPRGYVYRHLHVLEATRRLIEDNPQWRIPEMNRLLVESATHPDALDAITEEMGDDWKAHANDSEGGHIADRQTARGHVIRRDKSFFEDNREVLFPDIEEQIRTRIGDDRIDVAFAPSPASPFDPSRTIDKIPLTVRWLDGGEVPEAVEPTPADGGFRFSIGSRTFIYGRLGLRRAG